MLGLFSVILDPVDSVIFMLYTIDVLLVFICNHLIFSFPFGGESLVMRLT